MFDTESETVEILGRELRCHVCNNDRFWRKEAQLNTALASFLNFEWANTSGTCIICNQCGYIHWFYPMA